MCDALISALTEAWVTLATTDAYAVGCLVLGHSLRRVGTTRQTVVMITSGVSDPLRYVVFRNWISSFQHCYPVCYIVL